MVSGNLKLRLMCVVVVGEGEQYGRVAGWCQWVVLLPVIDAIGADFMCSPHDATAPFAPLIAVNSLNCVSFTRQAVTAIATIGGETIPQGVALLIVYTIKPFKFRVDVVVAHVVGGLRVSVSHIRTVVSRRVAFHSANCALLIRETLWE